MPVDFSNITFDDLGVESCTRRFVVVPKGFARGGIFLVNFYSIESGNLHSKCKPARPREEIDVDHSPALQPRKNSRLPFRRKRLVIIFTDKVRLGGRKSKTPLTLESHAVT